MRLRTGSRPKAGGCPAWIGAVPVAHRGLHGPGLPENSLAAFEAAARAGFAIELDIQGSADGVPIVFHDETLLRMTGDGRAVAALSAAELGGLRLSGSDGRIPVLQEVFDLVRGRVPVLIEIKNMKWPGSLEAAVAAAAARYQGLCAVQSFNPRVVRWFAGNAPDVARGLLSGDLRAADGLPAWQRIVLSNLLDLPYAKPDFIGYELAAMNALRRVAFRAFVRRPFLFWTVRTEAEARRARALGGNIIFEGFLPAAEPV